MTSTSWATDPEPARLHIATLTAAGWSQRAIAHAAHCSVQSVSRITRQLQDTANTSIVNAILAIDAATLPTDTYGAHAQPFVSRVGAVRRIQALLALGWTHRDLREKSGIRTNLMLSQQGRWVTRHTHDQIAALYEQLCMTPGPSLRTRLRAAKLGYALPLQWDDIDTDPAPVHTDSDLEDEGPAYDEVVVERRLDGDRTAALTKADRVEIIARARRRGWSLLRITEITGITKPERYLTDDLRRAS